MTCPVKPYIRYPHAVTSSAATLQVIFLDATPGTEHNCTSRSGPLRMLRQIKVSGASSRLLRLYIRKRKRLSDLPANGLAPHQTYYQSLRKPHIACSLLTLNAILAEVQTTSSRTCNQHPISCPLDTLGLVWQNTIQVLVF